MKQSILALCLVFALCGCKASSLGVGTTISTVDAPLIQQLNDAEDVVKIGTPNIEVSEEALLQQRTAYGVARNEALETYLNNILSNIQTAWPDENIPCSVFLVPSAAFDSYYANDTIFVAYGLFRELESEDEIAALLAHEYSHALLGHDSIGDLSVFMKKINGVASLYMRAKCAQEGAYGGLLEDYLMNYAANAASQDALLPVFSREQEDDADSLGTDLLIRAGYNPIGMVYLMQRLSDWEAKTKKVVEARKVKFAELVESETEKTATSVKVKTDVTLKPVMEQLTEQLSVAYDEIKSQHYDALEREQKVKTYIRKYYPEVPRDTLREKELQTVMSQKSTARFMRGLDHLDAYDTACSADDAKGAKKAVKAAYKTLHEDVSYARYLSIQDSLRTNAKAVDELKTACGRPDSLLYDYEKLITYYDQRDPAEALSFADEAFKKFDHPSRLLPTLVRLNTQLDNGLAAYSFYIMCIADGDPSLEAQCDAATK